MRAGAHALSLLSVPLNIHVITAVEDEPRSLIDLRRAVGSPPQTTMRKHLQALTQLGVLERNREAEFPGAVDYSLGRAGQELLSVAEVLRAWLASAPDGPLEPGTMAAKSAIKALVDGWSSTIVRVLAARPLSLTELNRLIATLNYPSLERRLAAMRLAGQIAQCPSGRRSRPYAVTTWLRRGVAPLSVAAGWERRYDRSATPVGRLDIEAAFLLAVPLVRLAADISGTARLAVEMKSAGRDSDYAGVLATVEGGKVTSCVSRLQGAADAWASGSISGWLATVIEGEVEALEIGGDRDLAVGLIDQLREALLAHRQTAV